MFVAATPVDCMPSPDRCANPAGRFAVRGPDGVAYHPSRVRGQSAQAMFQVYPPCKAGSQARSSSLGSQCLAQGVMVRERRASTCP